MHKNIAEFFNDRKETWLKAKNFSTVDESMQSQLQSEANDRFSLATWLPDAARRAGQLFMASHPSKFSHPSSKTSTVIATNSAKPDGYLRTGNAEYTLDVFGNAAAMDVYKFLSLTLDDDRTVLSHLEADTDALKALFDIPNTSFEELKSGFLAVKTSDSNTATDGLVKQVYFPVADDYHLLSILTPSGLLSRIKRQIDAMHFSDETKAAKEARRKGEMSEGYDDIYNLTVTAYGGTKPQNISVLNSQNGGVAYLLSSVPPAFEQRNVQLPAEDFFKNTLRRRMFIDDFQSLHDLMGLELNNMHIRNAITKVLKSIIDQILECAFQVRASGGLGWSDKEHYQNLPLYQCIWLDDAYNESRRTSDEWATGVGERARNHASREQDDMWLDRIINDCALWIILAYKATSYKATFKANAISLSNDELSHIRIMVDEAISADKEFFL